MIGKPTLFRLLPKLIRRAFRGFDAEKSIRCHQTDTDCFRIRNRTGKTYMKYGYYPTDKVDAESVFT